MAGAPSAAEAAYLNEDISYRLTAATTIILVFTTILLSLRLYTRTLPAVKPGPEDTLLVLAYILSVGACVCGYCEFQIPSDIK